MAEHDPKVAAARVPAHILVPALDEEDALPCTLRSVPRTRVGRLIVVDNGSRDGTAAAAVAAGAEVVVEPRRGYGAACQAGIAALAVEPDDDIVVFLDADGSSDPLELARLLEPIDAGRADLVIGARVADGAETVPRHARAGNVIALALIRLRTGVRYTDLGPFRAARLGTLRALSLRDRDFGWNVEMQLLAARRGVPFAEVPVRHARRVAGRSKISGSAIGTMRAGWKMLVTALRHAG